MLLSCFWPLNWLLLIYFTIYTQVLYKFIPEHLLCVEVSKRNSCSFYHVLYIPTSCKVITNVKCIDAKMLHLITCKVSSFFTLKKDLEDTTNHYVSKELDCSFSSVNSSCWNHVCSSSFFWRDRCNKTIWIISKCWCRPQLSPELHRDDVWRDKTIEFYTRPLLWFDAVFIGVPDDL